MRAGQANASQRTPTAHVEQPHAAACVISDRDKPPVWRELVVPNEPAPVGKPRETGRRDERSRRTSRPRALTPTSGARTAPAAVQRRPQVATALQAPRRQRQAQPLREPRPSHNHYACRHARGPLSPVPPQRRRPSPRAAPAPPSLCRATMRACAGPSQGRSRCSRSSPRPRPRTGSPRCRAAPPCFFALEARSPAASHGCPVDLTDTRWPFGGSRAGRRVHRPPAARGGPRRDALPAGILEAPGLRRGATQRRRRTRRRTQGEGHGGAGAAPA